MAAKNEKVLKTAVLVLGVVLILACATVSTPPAGGGSDQSAVETGIAMGIMATNVANQQMTLQAMQYQLTMQANMPPTQSLAPTQVPPPPTQNVPPPPPEPTRTEEVPQPLVLEILKSTDTFYCYQAPYRLTITVRVSDIERGMAVYYHIQDKSTGVVSDGQVIDLHRKGTSARDATIIGGGSSEQNLQFPPHMGESYFIYQIISDDGTFRSPAYSDITFYPCGN